jgi:hypothetical protein
MTARPLPTPEIEIESPTTLLIDHRSPPLFIDWALLYGQGKPFNVPLGPNGELVINVNRYRKVSILVSCTQGSSANLAELIFGILPSNDPFSSSFTVPLLGKDDGIIHTVDIVGPQFKCNLLNSDPTAKFCLAQVYLYFTS